MHASGNFSALLLTGFFAAIGATGALAADRQCVDNYRDLKSALDAGRDGILCPSATIHLKDALKFTKSRQKLYTKSAQSRGQKAKLIVSAGHMTAAIRTDNLESGGYSLRDIMISDIIVDGNRDRYGATVCRGNNDCAALITLYNLKNAVVSGVETMDPRGWSSIWAGGPKCDRVEISHSIFRDAGRQHDQEWADGISLACPNSQIHHNEITDVTDGGIIVFTAKGSQIYENKIRAENRNMFLGIGLTDYVEDGNYRGVVVRDNYIFADSVGYMLTGIAAGHRLWFGNKHAGSYNSGATVKGNIIRGGSVGFPITVSGAKKFVFKRNDVAVGGIHVDRFYNRRIEMKQDDRDITEVTRGALDHLPRRLSYVHRHFRHLFGRNPYQSELAHLSNDVMSQDCSVAGLNSMTQSMLDSPEYRRVVDSQSTDKAVTKLFQVVLDRKGDRRGTDHYARAVKRAGSRIEGLKSVAAKLYDSAEFTAEAYPGLCPR